MDRMKLIEAGINYDEGVQRFGGQSQMYEKYLKVLFENGHFQSLLEQVAAMDYQSAFGTAHSLKGEVGNLSLNKLYATLCDISNELRHGSPGERLKTEIEVAKGQYDIARAAVMAE